MSIQLVLQPDAAAGSDTYLMDGSSAEVNFGNAVVIAIGTSQSGKFTNRVRGLVRFDLSAIPLGAAIENATLTLFAATGGSVAGPAQFRAYRLTQPAWTEFGATWNKYNGTNSWSAAGGDYTGEGHDSTTVNSGSENLVFAALATLAADAVANRNGFLHLLFIGPEAGANNPPAVFAVKSNAPPPASPAAICANSGY